MQTPKTTLWIPPRIYSELMFYAYKVDAEVGGYGRLSFDEKENDIIVEEIFLVQQEVHQTECNLKAEGTAALYQELIDKGEPEKIGEITFWWHSHKNMGASFSTIDDDMMRTWPGSYLVSLVINRDGKMSAQLMSKSPLLVVGDIDIAINWFDVPEAEEWAAEVEKKVAKAKPIAVPQQQQIARYWNKNQGVGQGTPRGYIQGANPYAGTDWDDDYQSWCKGNRKSTGFHDMTEEEWKKIQEEEEAEWKAEVEGWLEGDDDLDEDEKAAIRKECGVG
jgi:proteasome lid subunit RPN8/RPN11